MSLVWANVRAAVHAFVVAASGIDAQAIAWADQDDNAPNEAGTPLWIVLHQGDVVPVTPQAERQHTFDAGRPVGQEIEFEAVQPCTVTFKVEAFGVVPYTAQDLLSLVQTKLQLPILRGGLWGAGLGVLGKSNVLNTSAVKNADFQSRAEFTIRCFVSETATERTGYIDRAEIGRQIKNEAGTLIVDDVVVIDSSP